MLIADLCHTIIGFDLGDGETALAETPLTGTDAPELIDVGGKKSQITALGYFANGDVVVGDEARMNRHVQRLLVRFKRMPAHAEFNEVAIGDFFGYFVRHLATEFKLPAANVRFIIGSPSGWPQEARDRYRAVLQRSGAADLAIIPESRAAFLHAKESGQFQLGEMKGTVLVIDIGSSTTDFTVVEAFHEKAADSGHVRLGAGLIEAAILERTIDASPSATAIRSILAANPHLRAVCEIRCRDAKEDYFSKESAGSDTTSLRPLLEIVDAEHILRITADDRLMRQVLSQPLPELDGKSWPDCYRGELLEIQHRWSEQPFSAVLLTGGGAKMKFTREICAELFPAARLIVDSAPEYCIARGLARVGRLDYRIKEFRRRLAAEGAASIKEQVNERLPRLFSKLANKIAEVMTREVVRPVTLQWRNAEIGTLAEYEDRMKSELELFGESASFKEEVQAAVDGWVNDTREELFVGVRKILAEFGIPTGILTLGDPVVKVPTPSGPSNPITVSIAYGVSAVTAAIVGYVIAAVCGGTGAALLMTGPIGFIPGVIAGAAIVILGPLYTTEYVKQFYLPAWIRAVCCTDAAVDGYCKDAKPQIAATVEQELSEVSEQIAFQISDALVRTIERKSEDIEVLIRA